MILFRKLTRFVPNYARRWAAEEGIGTVVAGSIFLGILLLTLVAGKKAQQAYDLLDRQPESAVQVVLTYGNSPM